jgi:hypothetical protein
VVAGEDNVWKLADFLDEQEIAAYLLSNPVVVNMGEIIGFAGIKHNKKGEQQSLIFKIKRVTDKSAKGADCAASSDKFKVLNELVAINNGVEIPLKAIEGKGTCVLVELILRMMDRPDKRWFFNFEDSVASGVVVITKAAASMSSRV